MSHTITATSCQTHQLKQMPSILQLYRKAILPKKHKATSADQIPHLSVELSSVSLNSNQIREYSDVCNFYFDGRTIPVTYPHILAFGVQLALMVNPAFPIPLLGLVHVRNKIQSYRGIDISETLDFHVSLSEARDTDKGIEFDLTTQVTSKGERVWESVSTNLYRFKTSPKRTGNYQPKALDHYRFSEFWDIKENTGRQYAKASGDSNPIHLYKWTAKAFGFKQAIIHGMWTKARTVAALEPRLKTHALQITTEFKQPIFLPSRVVLHYNESESGMDFEVRNDTNDKVHMRGQVQKF